MSKFPNISFTNLILFIFFCAPLLYLYKNKLDTYNMFLNTTNLNLADVPKITIGLVSCRRDNDTTSNIETSVLIKSVLISSLLYGVKEIEFHIFLEYFEDNTFFREILQKYGFPNESISVTISFHSAVTVVPKSYWNQMIYHKRFRCGFTRFYFPTELKDVDSIIYMDTDFIITGNILELWKHFQNMNIQQLIGVVQNNSPEKLPVKYKLANCHVPHVHPTGLNSGLLLMNLTKMREYGWEDKISRAFEDYSKVKTVTDQAILNIVLYYNPGLLYKLPCQFNVRCSPCNNALLCKDIRQDPYGIQCIHGAYNQFDLNGRFYYIYKQYMEFNIRRGDTIKDLMIPITQHIEPQSKSGDQKCDPKVNEYLFRNVLFSNVNY